MCGENTFVTRNQIQASCPRKLEELPLPHDLVRVPAPGTLLACLVPGTSLWESFLRAAREALCLCGFSSSIG